MSRRVVSRVAAPLGLRDLGLAIATDAFATVSMTLDASQEAATVRRLGADGIAPARRDDPVALMLAAACSLRGRTLPAATHALVKSASPPALGGRSATIIAGALAVDGMFDLGLSDGELIDLVRGYGVTLPELTAAMLGGLAIADAADDGGFHRRESISDSVGFVACEVSREAALALRYPPSDGEPDRAHLAQALGAGNQAALAQWFETREATAALELPAFHRSIVNAARQAGAFGLLPTFDDAAMIAIAPRSRIGAVASAISDAGASLRVEISAQARVVADDWRRVVVHPACDEPISPAPPTRSQGTAR